MTQLLWQIVFSNAVTAAALALLAGAIGLLVKKPAVMRAAWIIVLLKLLTPPVWTVPVQWPAERPHQQVAPVQTITTPNLPAMVDLSSELPAAAAEIGVELPPIEAPPLPGPHVPVWRVAITW